MVGQANAKCVWCPGRQAQEESGRVWQATVTDLKDRNEELQLLLDKSQTESKKEVAEAWEREQKMRKDADIMKTRMEEQGDRLNAMIGKVRELKDECKKIVSHSHSLQSVALWVCISVGRRSSVDRGLFCVWGSFSNVATVSLTWTNRDSWDWCRSTASTSHLLFSPGARRQREA